MLKGIFVIAGHGKSGGTAAKNYSDAVPDSGATGNGTTERAEVLQIARETVALLKRDPDLKGAKIFLIDQDMTVQEKVQEVKIAMNYHRFTKDETCLIDIHLNSAGVESARGCETWHGKNDSKDFAVIVLEEVVKATGFPVRSVKSSDQNRHGRLGILDDTDPQACLLECGFITNELDSAFIKDNKLDDLFAIGIHRAVRRQAGFPADVSLPASGFLDVPDGAWFAPAVKDLREIGVFEEAEDGMFHPEAPVNRAQMATVMHRILLYLQSLKK
jgi:hypothetical protein